ncbi:hypothetical protein PHYSODRAFT_354900 [Phytophthora sojae]|uniref:Uncharacterized protein n=1 Tax=Phytophthora sojae (strain P6497) TaxID=1094619 RepID=G4ZPY7_PHYSP|nr:hypothetical protein PHYSODRAFT_354900 [Phytophthora sojae]EGZ16391.1 hypothetical protein PHYSODRAFT_354900 [Phytophthora sojae]|eukprot:XP_009530140.1 hypothetical protein PHYSODRAFT_354900 [Phytophthora sojae]
MIFDSNSCYVRASGSCPFGADCTGVFFSGSSGSGSSNSTTVSSSTQGSTTSATADTTSQAGSFLSQANSAGGPSSETEATDSADSGSSTVLIVAILGVAVVIVVLGVVVRKLFLRARAASEQNADEEEIPSPLATETTASFSSNGTSRDAGAVVARSAIGTDLSESKPVSV